MKKLLLFSFIFGFALSAYELGHGYKVNDKLHFGGYFSAEYSLDEKSSLFVLDDFALMAYGDLNDKWSYMSELEASPVYEYDFKLSNGQDNLAFHKERLYIDYKSSENIKLRVGKQISPIGYWNLEPINVLRETSSNPLLSYKMFPKFLSGLDVYGFVPGFESLSYHLFAQNNKDIDENYINIKIKDFYGFSFENEFEDGFKYGATLGIFTTKENEQSNIAALSIKNNTLSTVTQIEAVYKNHENLNASQRVESISSYLQSTYKVNTHNSIIGRYEYFKDGITKNEEHIGIFGYGYRPVYSISIKGEYQWHSDSNMNKFQISFSALF